MLGIVLVVIITGVCAIIASASKELCSYIMKYNFETTKESPQTLSKNLDSNLNYVR